MDFKRGLNILGSAIAGAIYDLKKGRTNDYLELTEEFYLAFVDLLLYLKIFKDKLDSKEFFDALTVCINNQQHDFIRNMLINHGIIVSPILKNNHLWVALNKKGVAMAKATNKWGAQQGLDDKFCGELVAAMKAKAGRR